MSTKNSTSATQLDVSEVTIRSYWKGFARRLSIPVAAAIIIHIGARIIGAYAYYDFNLDFGGSYTGWEVFGLLFQLHLMSLVMLILMISIPYLLFLGLRWLIKGY